MTHRAGATGCMAPSDLGSHPSSTGKPVASGEASDLPASETSTHLQGWWGTCLARRRLCRHSATPSVWRSIPRAPKSQFLFAKPGQLTS